MNSKWKLGRVPGGVSPPELIPFEYEGGHHPEVQNMSAGQEASGTTLNLWYNSQEGRCKEAST